MIFLELASTIRHFHCKDVSCWRWESGSGSGSGNGSSKRTSSLVMLLIWLRITGRAHERRRHRRCGPGRRKLPSCCSWMTDSPMVDVERRGLPRQDAGSEGRENGGIDCGMARGGCDGRGGGRDGLGVWTCGITGNGERQRSEGGGRACLDLSRPRRGHE